MGGDFNTGFIDDEYRFMRKEEVSPHKYIALASAAIAALYREQERALRLLEKGVGERSHWREAGKRASLRSVSNFSVRGWKR
jgi:hypothetical protein